MRVVDTEQQVYVLALCGRCLATALEGLTDQRYINLYEAWQASRAAKNYKRVYRRKI